MKRIEVSEQIVRLFEKQQKDLGYSNLTSYMNDLAIQHLGLPVMTSADIEKLVEYAIEPCLANYSQAFWVPETQCFMIRWPMHLVKDANSSYKSLTYCVQIGDDNRLSIEHTVKFEGYTIVDSVKDYLRALSVHLKGFAYKEYTNDTFVYKRNIVNHYKDDYYGYDVKTIGQSLYEEITQIIEALNTYYINP